MSDAPTGASSAGPVRRRLGPALRVSAGALAVLLAMLLVRAFTFGVAPAEVADAPAVDVDPAASAERLGASIRIQTISRDDPALEDDAPFEAFGAWMAEAYPRVHGSGGLVREAVGDRGWLYVWPAAGATIETAFEAPVVVLMGHIDVVPIEPGTEGDWTHPPFSGAVADGHVWGRGALDFKFGVVGLLEAAEALVAEGFAPSRTVVMTFGMDEEVGGRRGATRLAAALAARGARADWVLDEGLPVTRGMMPGVDPDVALIGIAEKGYVSVELVATADGGHSSMPPRPTAAGRLAGAVHRLQTSPFPADLEGPVGQMFAHVGDLLPFGQRVAVANRWLLGGAVAGILGAKPSTNALIRTTTAPTVLRAGVQDNVLPSEARAVINFRILPGDTVDSVVARVRELVDDPAVSVTALGGLRGDPSAVSSTDHEGFRAVHDAIRQTFPQARVAPSLFIAATDSRHMAGLGGPIYRFAPQLITPTDRVRIHGTDERVSVATFADAVRFYARVMRTAGTRS